MEVRDHEKADNDQDKAGTFDFVVGRGAVCEMFGDPTIEHRDGAAGNGDKKAGDGGTKIIMEVHENIVA